MRLLLGWLALTVAMAATEDPFAKHDREAWTKALDNSAQIATSLLNQALRSRHDPEAVARCWAYSDEMRIMLQKCNGNANAETLRVAGIALKSLDEYVDRQIKSPPRKPPRG